jgi:hypothetical protein
LIELRKRDLAAGRAETISPMRRFFSAASRSMALRLT